MAKATAKPKKKTKPKPRPCKNCGGFMGCTSNGKDWSCPGRY